MRVPEAWAALRALDPSEVDRIHSPFDLAAMLAEQRQTNRLLSMIVWVGVGFVLGLLAAQLVIRLHGLGVI